MKAKRKIHRNGWPQELYRANLKALSRYHPDLAGRLEKAPLAGRYRVTASPAGGDHGINLEMPAGGVYYHMNWTWPHPTGPVLTAPKVVLT